MKKIYSHELNELKQARALRKCIYNRAQLHEAAPIVAAGARMVIPLLRPLITKLVKKAIVKIGKAADPKGVLKHVIDKLSNGEVLKKLADKTGEVWNEIPKELKDEIFKIIVDVFRSREKDTEDTKNAKEEEEEENVSIFDEIFKYRPEIISRVSPMVKEAFCILYKKYGENMGNMIYIGRSPYVECVEHIEEMEGYASDAEELVAILLGEKRIRIEEDEEDDDDEFEDDISAEEKHKLVLVLVKKQISDKKYFDIVYKAVEQIANSFYDWPAFESDDEITSWWKRHYDDVDKLLNRWEKQREEEEEGYNSPMARKDFALRLSEDLADGWLDVTEEEMDDVYYAVLSVLDKTGDYPMSTSFEDCEEWCNKHLEEIEKNLGK